jgi:hypothetical protein
MPSKLDWHLATIETWLAAEPQLTALAIVGRLAERDPETFGPKQHSIVQRLLQALRTRAAEKLLVSTGLSINMPGPVDGSGYEGPDPPTRPSSRARLYTERRRSFASGLVTFAGEATRGVNFARRNTPVQRRHEEGLRSQREEVRSLARPVGRCGDERGPCHYQLHIAQPQASPDDQRRHRRATVLFQRDARKARSRSSSEDREQPRKGRLAKGQPADDPST